MAGPRPLLLVDVDGVISLFGFAPHERPAGTWTTVDGHPHLLSATAGAHLRRLAATFELAWCTGWEERANEYLPHALALPGPLPHLAFDRDPAGPPPPPRAHWKLAGIDAFAGADRPLAWVDDAFNDACHAWAAARPGPTLLVPTETHVGLTAAHVEELERWAAALERSR
ncbi:MAG TPA: hypothetical protein VFR97_01600 [Capillimicrobium sp.]|nr:hypothetical protein [Capillimicrobium sp.]